MSHSGGNVETFSLYGGRPAAGLTPARMIAAGAAAAATGILLVGLAMQQLAPDRALEEVRVSLILIPPAPPIAEPPPPLDPAVEPPPRPSSVVPDRPVDVPDDAPQTWITPAPAEPGSPEAPAGLRGLMRRDPCLDPVERLRRQDCPPEFDRQAMASARAKDIEQRRDRDQFLAFAERKNCSVSHGCMDDIEPGSVARPTARSATSSLGGMNDTVGRLGPPNWYHVDPGFGD